MIFFVFVNRENQNHLEKNNDGEIDFKKLWVFKSWN